MNLLAKLEQMRAGVRVRAPQSIFYADTGFEVAEGAEGEIVEVMCGGGVVNVVWDGDDTPRRTGFNSIEVL